MVDWTWEVRREKNQGDSQVLGAIYWDGDDWKEIYVETSGFWHINIEMLWDVQEEISRRYLDIGANFQRKINILVLKAMQMDEIFQGENMK